MDPIPFTNPINQLPNLCNLQRGPDYLMTPVQNEDGDEVEIFSRRDLFEDPAIAHDIWTQIAFGIARDNVVLDGAERVWVGMCKFMPFVGKNVKQLPDNPNIDPRTFTQWAPVIIVLYFNGTEGRWAYDMDLHEITEPWFDLATGEMLND